MYPALHRMEQQGWLRAEWGVADNRHEARFYAVTAMGRKQLSEEEASWATLSEGVRRVLRYV